MKTEVDVKKDCCKKRDYSWVNNVSGHFSLFPWFLNKTRLMGRESNTSSSRHLRGAVDLVVILCICHVCTKYSASQNYSVHQQVWHFEFIVCEQLVYSIWLQMTTNRQWDLDPIPSCFQMLQLFFRKGLKMVDSLSQISKQFLLHCSK